MKFTWPRVLLLALLAVVLSPIGLIFGYTEYKFHPINSFCSDIPPTATSQQILEFAKGRGFEDAGGNKDEVMVFNHQQGPMFRYICDVKFKDGKQISKEVIDGD